VVTHGTQLGARPGSTLPCACCGEVTDEPDGGVCVSRPPSDLPSRRSGRSVVHRKSNDARGHRRGPVLRFRVCEDLKGKRGGKGSQSSRGPQTSDAALVDECVSVGVVVSHSAGAREAGRRHSEGKLWAPRHLARGWQAPWRQSEIEACVNLQVRHHTSLTSHPHTALGQPPSQRRSILGTLPGAQCAMWCVSTPTRRTPSPRRCHRSLLKSTDVSISILLPFPSILSITLLPLTLYGPHSPS
jgi:hypothetical protein